MMKRILLAAVLGILLGLGARAYTYWNLARTAAEQGKETASLALSATCEGGATPRIQVAWPPLFDNAIDGLERKVDSGAFEPVFTSQPPVYRKFYWRDTSVALGHTYQYRVTKDGKEFGSTATVTTSASSCR